MSEGRRASGLGSRMAAACLMLPVALCRAEPTDIISPIVSYQYQDSLATEGTTLISPVVSYQYYDWIGDGNVTFQNSPAVSYYFGGGAPLLLTGTVRDPSGQPVSGAEVIIQRYNTAFWHGYTTASGSIPTPDLPAGNFNIVVIKAGYTSLFQSIPGDAGGPLAINLILFPVFALPDVVTVTRTPEATAIRTEEEQPIPGVRNPHLRVFNGSAFSSSGVILPDRMTIVIAHGWNSNLDGWAALMAGEILGKHSLTGAPPNIVGWDWRARAAGIRLPIDEAVPQGENLGKALYQELGPNYNERVHFIGHSLGTIVNAYACDYLHGELSRQNHPAVPWEKAVTRPHVTLLDQAELGNVFGSNVATSSAVAWLDSQSRSQLFDVVNGSAGVETGYKSPFPKSAAWMDNYITLVGLYNRSAVNVYLPAGFDTLLGAHTDAHQWYRQSIVGVSPQHAMGFARSYERALVFPPSGNGTAPGSVWTSIPETADLFDLNLIQNPGLLVGTSSVMRAATVVPGTTLGTLDAGGQAVLNGYEASLNWVGDLGGSAIVKTGQVVSSVGEKVGNFWDATLDKASTINPETLFTGSVGSPTLKLLFSTPVQTAQIRQTAKATSASAPAPPQAWVPVHVPADAGFLVFDFTVTGEPADDLIACAINEKNLFTLRARFAPDGSPVSTDFLDISAYAGQDVELYFGLVGGTSNGCTLAIDGIRFVTIPTPRLAATVVGNQVKIQWPAAASGWVPQRNPDLDPDGWEDITFTEAAAVEGGVMTWEKARLPTKEFFRLRRSN